jgi:hypothetical protein
MKKILFALIACLTHCAFAQKSFFGIDAGLNIANQRTVSKIISNGKTILNDVGFQFNQVRPAFGFFYHYQFSENVGIRANAQYMGLGYKSKTDTSLNINYLTFPLTFHYNVTKNLSFNTGAYVSFTLGGTKINNQDITKTYHKNDFGINIGAEYELYKNFSIAAMYIIGLKNIWLNDTETVPPPFNFTVNSKHTNRALQFTLIYKFKKLI